MFKFNYNQIVHFSFPKALRRYRNNQWFREKFFVWTIPPVARDSFCLLFVISFCFLQHSSSHFVLLYVIISISIYYYWVRFQQLKYSEPLPGKLQTVFDLSFDIRYLNAFVPRSTFFVGFCAYICIIGVYLFYAAKSIFVIASKAATERGSTLLGKLTPSLVDGRIDWIESIKKSSSGFFPVSGATICTLTGCCPLQCLVDPSDFQGKFGLTENSFYFGKYLSFAYIFDNKGSAPFFGRFTTDLEILKALENFSFEKFSLFQFLLFTFRIGLRIWIPLFSGGYQNLLVWWIHPLNEASFINLFGQSRYIFEPFRLAVSVILENSIQQIYAAFYMDRWVLPFCANINQMTLPLSWLKKSSKEIEPFLEQQPVKLSSVCVGETKLSQCVFWSLGYILKYAPIYIPGEQARFRGTQKIVEILFSPFLVGFQLLVFTSCCFQNFLNCVLATFIGCDIVSTVAAESGSMWSSLNPAVVFSPF